jgi:hypothetical protein
MGQYTLQLLLANLQLFIACFGVGAEVCTAQFVSFVAFGISLRQRQTIARIALRAQTRGHSETDLAIKLGLWSKVKNQTQLKSGGAKIGLQLRLDVEWKALRRLVFYDDGMVDYHVGPLAT